MDKATDSIVAVKDPFGPQSAASCPPICHFDGPSIIQHGISSMPVSVAAIHYMIKSGS